MADAGRFPCLFVTDLHGRENRYEALFRIVREVEPRALFLGGDLFPHGFDPVYSEFFQKIFLRGFREINERLSLRVFAILGNDDTRQPEPFLQEMEVDGLLTYLNGDRLVQWEGWTILGYPFVPPTPFRVKDWERYDVSRFVDPGCLSPEEGVYTFDVDLRAVRLQTIWKDLRRLGGKIDPGKTIGLFHSPPYKTNLDRAALDGKQIDFAPLDVHIGSVAIRRFIEKFQPALTFHGHVHESTRLTGEWRENLGNTTMMNGAHDGLELAVIGFDPDFPERAERFLVP